MTLTPEALTQILNRDLEVECGQVSQLANDQPRLPPIRLASSHIR